MKELKELLKSGLTKETIAARLQVSTRSVERWRDNTAKPRERDRKRILRMYSKLASITNAFNS